MAAPCVNGVGGRRLSGGARVRSLDGAEVCLDLRSFLAVAEVASAAAVPPVVLIVASVCWPLTEAPATTSLLHIEVKMALVGFIRTRPKHGAEDGAV